MALEKLGNPKLQQAGEESANITHDERTHQLLHTICMELKAIRVILAEAHDMDDLEFRDLDLDIEEL